MGNRYRRLREASPVPKSSRLKPMPHSLRVVRWRLTRPMCSLMAFSVICRRKLRGGRPLFSQAVATLVTDQGDPHRRFSPLFAPMM